MMEEDCINNLVLTPEEEELLTLMEQGTELKVEQVERLENNPALLRDYVTLQEATTSVRQKVEFFDIEERLAYVKRHARRRSIARIVAWTAGVAAVSAGVWFGITRFQTDPLIQAEETLARVEQTTGEAPAANQAQTVVVPEELTNGRISFRDHRAFWKGPMPKILRVQVPAGQSLEVELADGSKVWMHPGSDLVFASHFERGRRRVLLRGEAYFQVAHDDDRPFTVTAGNVTVTDLGTEFDVAAYSDEPLAVTLISGSVKVKTPEGEQTLAPGHQLACSADKVWRQYEVDVEPYTSWRDGYFYFDQATLGEIIGAIRRNCKYEVRTLRPEKMNLRMHFVADRKAPIDSILSRLNAFSGVKMSRKGKVIVVE